MKRALFVCFCAWSSLGAQESLTPETIAANRGLWPREVTVNVAHTVPIVVAGKPSGSMQAAAGRVYPLKQVTASDVQVDALGSLLKFPAADTDLVARAEQVQARQAELAARTPAAVAQSTPKPTATPPPAPTNKIAATLSGDLVALDGKKVKPFDAAALGSKKYLAVYFSASWCGPCRNFTPELVKFYNRKKASQDKFDVIFVSMDRSEEAMEAYMADDKMPWPAVTYQKAGSSPLRKLCGPGIPCLVVLDENGTVVSDSYQGKEYVGPTKVMRDLEKLIKDS